MALIRLEEFETERGKRYPAIDEARRRSRDDVIPLRVCAGDPQK
jgi:hypothetical protein